LLADNAIRFLPRLSAVVNEKNSNCIASN
jgi:hypothetical protein